ncbi:Uncharacterised protein [Mycobacteroides abscessus subsp. abscessus]|nr:Uncharacterised protein [Mycobacteroides abscessus subsp. abscessus]SIB34446.1 Uncharacterised protein [Mycobacteroides abscessus subsp. abscessus]SIG00806.1 Uncharacterised protein [Mycobacteroides abscessus subsp. abscessus]
MSSPLDTAVSTLHDLIVTARAENPGTSPPEVWIF